MTYNSVNLNPEDIVVIGGGITAEAMATALSQHDIPCTLVNGKSGGRSGNKSPDLQPQASVPVNGNAARTVALWQNSLDILQRISINIAALSGSHLITGLCLVDENNNESLFFPQQAELEADHFGVNVRLDQLHAALVKRNATCDRIKRVQAFSRHLLGPGQIQLSNGETTQAKLVIVAEGMDSFVAQQAGIHPLRFHQGLTAVIMQVQHDTTHAGVSYEFHRPPGPLAFVPQAEHHSAIVWLHKDGSIPDLTDHPALLTRLNADSHQRMAVQKILNTPQAIPLTSRQVLTLRAERLCLIGEAAHKLPPTGAQGLNLTLRDIDCLMSLLRTAAEQGKDFGNDVLLSHYSGQRLRDNWGVSTAVHMANNSIRHGKRFNGLLSGVRQCVQHRLAPRYPKLTAVAIKRAIYGF